MTQIPKLEKILGVTLIVLTVSSLGMLYYFGFIHFNTDVIIVTKYPDISLDLPINPIYANDGSGDLFVLEHKGKVKVITDPKNDPITALDLSVRDNFHWDWEGGLLGLTFDPNFSTNHFLYVFYTESDDRVPVFNETIQNDGCDPCVTSILSRFNYDQANHKILEETELRILQVPQFVAWHRAGQMNFGPDDGMFYVDIGDSLRGGTELNNLYGKILRIDVSQSSDSERYEIPEDNPFFNNLEGYREEIYAYGLRNPWRASFDAETHTFWAADVGKDMFEELNKIEAGNNYGWNITEGMVCTHHDPDCNPEDFTLPIFAYPHESTGDLDKPSGVAIIGGYIYRGEKFPELEGKYIFGDYSGAIWSLTFNEDYTKVTKTKFLARMPVLLSSIGLDPNGEIIFAGHAGGKLYEFERLTEAISSVILWGLLYLIGITTVTIFSFYLQARRKKVDLVLKNMKKHIAFRFFILNALLGLGYILYYSIILTLYSFTVPE